MCTGNEVNNYARKCNGVRLRVVYIEVTYIHSGIIAGKLKGVMPAVTPRAK